MPYLSVFKTRVVTEGDFYNGKVKQHIIDNLNAELVEEIREELRNRVETVRII